jgi:hypothetical protein
MTDNHPLNAGYDASIWCRTCDVSSEGTTYLAFIQEHAHEVTDEKPKDRFIEVNWPRLALLVAFVVGVVIGRLM